MIIPKEILFKYNLLEPYFKKAKEIIDQTLLNYSSFHHFAYLSRIKSVDSLAEKIESGRYKDWDSIDDFIGAVIIIPHLNVENEVVNFLKDSFNEIFIKKRGSTFKSPDVFRFDSTRFIGRLNKITTEETIHQINFEVQIRSAFEHAWSVATHDLSYKSSSIDWKVLRLASQLKSSVEQLDMIITGAQKIKDSIQEHLWPDTEVKSKICSFFENLILTEIIPIELKPKDMSRFSENIFVLINGSLDLKNSKKWKKKLTNIFNIFQKEFLLLGDIDFPRSLSLYQLCFGILMKTEILENKIIREHPFHKGDLFDMIFPECKNISTFEFKI